MDAFVVYALIGAAIVLFIIAIHDALNHGRWRCPACDFESWSEEEALGHQARYAQHKPVQD